MAADMNMAPPSDDDHHDDSLAMPDAPPSRIAAPFYRPSTRRHSSAASSRRNSLSSAPSRTSSRNAARRSSTSNQSLYIAQHLRRASIIQSRKDRLADRAAHAEQVRLRAALAKAAPRGTNCHNSSEERALAAQLAKEKYLAKVAAACAEEVARAKRIAEEVKERKGREEARARGEMEMRSRDVERRRVEMLRSGSRTGRWRRESEAKALAVVEEVCDGVEEEVTVLDVDTAARRIQHTWRLTRRRAIVNAFASLDLTQHRASNITFDDMTILMADARVLSATTALLTHLQLQHPNDSNASLNTRTFLSAYILAAHPAAVLNNKNGAQEQDLVAKSSELLASFQTCVSWLNADNTYTPFPVQLEQLNQAYSAYTSAFAAWRLQDSSALIEGMVASFVGLDAIWQTVKDDTRGDVANDYREGIRDNQVMLLARIRKLAGADRADTLIKKAIRESRREQAKKLKRRSDAEVRPRGVEEVADDAMQAPLQETSIVQTTSQASRGPSSTLSISEATRQLFSIMPSNRILTHELALDKDYRLTDVSEGLRNELYRSICASMKQGFEQGEGNLWTLSAAENIREKLLRMLKPGSAMYTSIYETLDGDSIARQTAQGVFSYDGFFNYMASVLPKLCAPFRDAEVKVLVEMLEQSSEDLDQMIEKLYRVLRAVDLLSLDYTNFMVMQAAPTLIREAAGYERRMFATDLEAGRISIERTTSWWRRARESVAFDGDPAPAKVYAHGLVSLATEQGPLDHDQVPETLELDTARFEDTRASCTKIVVVGAILLTAKNLLKRDVRGQWKTEADRLWALVNAPTTSNEDSQPTLAQKAFSILETAHNMPPTTKQQLANLITRFVTHASTAAKFTDPVLKVLAQRLRAHVLLRLTASTTGERVRAAAGASDVLTACGLGEMGTQVAGLVERLEAVRRVDWEAHGEWYERVEGEVEG